MSNISARVRETTTTVGTGDVVLGGAVATHVALASFPDTNDYFPYAIIHRTAAEVEIGMGRLGVATPVAFVSAGTGAAVANGTVNPGLPAGIAIGDLLIIVASVRQISSTSIDTPTGYLRQGTYLGATGSNISQMAVFYRFVDGTETPPAVSITGGGTNVTTLAQIFAYRNIHPTTPFGLVGTTFQVPNIEDIGPIPGIPSLRRNNAVFVIGYKGDDNGTGVDVLTGDGLTWVEAGELSTVLGSDASFVVNHAINNTGADVVISPKTFEVNAAGAGSTGVAVMFELQGVGASLIRTIITQSSNSNSVVNFTAGIKDVVVDADEIEATTTHLKFFGDGFLGDFTGVGQTTLANNSCYRNIYLPNTSGFAAAGVGPLFCHVLDLTNVSSGVIQMRARTSGTGVGVAGSTTGTAGTAGASSGSISIGGSGSAGGAGGAGVINAAGGVGVQPAASTLTNGGRGGAGGAGGSGQAGLRAGGAGGAPSVITEAAPRRWLSLNNIRAASFITGGSGGGGGGAGGGGATTAGPGGGGGASGCSNMIICARVLKLGVATMAGAIQAIGALGGAGGASTADSRGGAGGGGGGGGGWIILVIGSIETQGPLRDVVDVDGGVGGVGGVGFGTGLGGQGGAGGNAGRITIFRLDTGEVIDLFDDVGAGVGATPAIPSTITGSNGGAGGVCRTGFDPENYTIPYEQFLQVYVDPNDLDGSNNSTLTDGQLVDTVVNKGLLGGTFTAAGALRPTYRATGGSAGGPCLEFTGTEEMRSSLPASSFIFLHNGTSFSALFRYRSSLANPDKLQTILITAESIGASASRGLCLFNDDRASVPREDRQMSFLSSGSALNATLQSADDAAPTQTWLTASTILNQINNTMYQHINGVAAGSAVMSGVFSPLDPTITLAIGRNALFSGVTSGLDGKLGPIMIFNVSLETAARPFVDDFINAL